MQSRILGTTMPVLEVLLQPGEGIISEAGELSWMTQSIQMTTHTQMGGGGRSAGRDQARRGRRDDLYDRILGVWHAGGDRVRHEGAGPHPAD